MKKVFTLSGVFIVCSAVYLSVYASAPASWTASFNSPKNFVENKSQFNNNNKLKGSQILFGAQESGAKVYFTKNGLTVRFDKIEPKNKREDIEEEQHAETSKSYREREREEHEVKVTTDVIHVQWENANPNVDVEATGLLTGYYTYHVAGKNLSARAFEKLTYKNLYPGIDVEYSFHPEQGLKYVLIVHPGADPSLAKMKLTGSKNISMDEAGNMHIATLFGDIVDHAPVTFYQAEAGSSSPEASISSRFIKNGRVISFELGSYDHSQTIVIDPLYQWNPAFSGGNKAFDVETDAAGNVYAYGGETTIELKKFSPTGVWQWTYTTPWSAGASPPDIWFGTLRTAPTGESYITVGSTAVIDKVDAAGNFAWRDTPGGFLSAMEYWELTFNCDFTKLYAGGTQAFGNGYIFSLNLANGKQTGSVQAAAAVNEVRSLSSSPNGKLYFHTQGTIGEVSSALALNWSTPAGYSFSYGGPTFGQPENRRGQHVIKASSSYIYTMNGATLSRRNITTGAIINSVTIPGGNFGSGSPYNNGIDLDSCGNVYVGSGSAVYKYDGALTLITSATTPNGTAVFDVCVSNNGQVLISGGGFVASIPMSACKQVVPICYVTATPLAITTTNTNPSCSGQCTGTGTANITTGTPPYIFTWNNGQTAQTATGLCAGTYSVTVNDASNIPVSSTITVAAPTALSPTPSSAPVTCNGMNDGGAGVTVTGGSPGYSYSWNNGKTTASISNLSAGTYIVTITDTKGCTTLSTSVVSEPPPLVLNFQRVYYICGEGGGSVQLTATGGTSYSWSPGETLDDSLSSGPLAFPYITTTYTVTVANGACKDTALVTINFVPFPTPPTISQLGDTLSVPNKYLHYQWYFEGSPMAGDTLYYELVHLHGTGNYSVYVTDSFGCRVITQSVYATDPTGVFENIQKHGIIIFPNPAKSEFTVFGLNSYSKGTAYIKIYDAVGQIVYSDEFKGDQKTISCNWSPGVYFIRVENVHESYMGKIIIQ